MESISAGRATRWLRHISLLGGHVHLLLDDGTVWRIEGEGRVERFLHRRYRDLELLGEARARVAVFGDGERADLVFAGHGLEGLLGGDLSTPTALPPSRPAGLAPTA